MKYVKDEKLRKCRCIQVIILNNSISGEVRVPASAGLNQIVARENGMYS